MTKSLPNSVDDILLSHAAGALDAGFALLVETHLEMSPSAREVHAQFEALGGALLEEIAPAEVDAAALNKALIAIDAEEAPVHREAMRSPRVPPCQKVSRSPPFLRDRRSDLALDRSGRSFRAYRASSSSASRAFLIEIAPGVRVPKHGHESDELTCVCAAASGTEMRVIAKGRWRVSTRISSTRSWSIRMFPVSV